VCDLLILNEFVMLIDQARYDWFGELPLIIEDFVKDAGGQYTCSEVRNSPHERMNNI
jgi:hypothetical protein